MEQELIRQMLEKKGFIDEPVSPDLKLIEEINRLKKEKNAVILSHYYVTANFRILLISWATALVCRRKQPKPKPTLLYLLASISWPRRLKLSILRKK
jgi:quinolinate synthase